ncbi:MAG: leucine-rich repeat domain-containing protein [Clostridia bacterium]|nr:leucine-rich repeat domain-containing protein [Clostridia bacterium]
MKKSTIAILVVIGVLLSLFISSRQADKKAEQDSRNVTDTVGQKIICKAADFEAKREDWYGRDELVSEEARSIATSDLVIGEKYYFVYTFKLSVESNDKNYILTDFTMNYDLQFGIKSWEGLYYGRDAVTFEEEILTADDIHAEFNDKGEIVIARKENISVDENGNLVYEDVVREDIKTYVAVAFIPQHTGMLMVDSIVCGYDKNFYSPLEDKVPRIFANVMDAESDIQDSAVLTVSNLSYGLVGQEVYEGGQLEQTSDLASISQMKIGQNYVVLDFDVTSDSNIAGEVCCGIYMHEGDWQNVTLQQANTAKLNQTDIDGGKIFDFSYSLPKKGQTKNIRTVISFTVEDICSIDFEFFVYSENAHVSGTLYDCDYFANEGISALNMRVDHSEHKCYVAGYETMTGKVAVPGFYEEYPVVEIDEGAFAGCTELRQVNLNSIKKIGWRAFQNCTALEKIELGKVEEITASAFEGCTALVSMEMPETLSFIERNAFLGCSSLKNAVFANPYTWEPTGKNSKMLNMDSPMLAAQYIVENYVEENIFFRPCIEIQNITLGFVDEATYNSGNYEDKIIQNWDRTMVRNSKYYWVLEFDTGVKASEAEDQTWQIFMDNVKGYSFQLKEISGERLDVCDVYQSGDGYNITLYYGEKNDELRHVRVVFEVIPVSGNRRVELVYYSGGVINSYDDKIIAQKIDISVW